MNMLHMTWDFCRNSLKLCLFHRSGNQMGEHGAGKCPTPKPMHCAICFLHPPNYMFLLQMSYSYGFILGDVNVFAGLKFGKLKSPCFQGTGERWLTRCAGCWEYQKRLKKYQPSCLLWKSKNFPDQGVIKEKDAIHLTVDNAVRSKGKQ